MGGSFGEGIHSSAFSGGFGFPKLASRLGPTELKEALETGEGPALQECRSAQSKAPTARISNFISLFE
jgi:hypothetical protein